MIYGNEKTRRSIRGLLEQKSSCVSMVSGPIWTGKTSFFNEVSESIYSDFFMCDGSMDSVREFIEFCLHGPSLNSTKLAFFPEADSLSFSAQDALLRVFEEPPKSFKFFLLVENDGLIVDPLKSRIRENLYWDRLNDEEMVEFTSSLGPVDKFSKSLSKNIPGLYSRIKHRNIFSEIHNHVKSVLSSKFRVLDSIPESCTKLKDDDLTCALLVIKHTLMDYPEKSKLTPFFKFISLMVKFPSCNFELHWRNAVFDFSRNVK